MSQRSVDALQPPGPSSYERFKPRHPIDPFKPNRTSGVPRGRPFGDHWKVDVKRLDKCETRKEVILIIGDPPLPALECLLNSAFLAESLLILAAYSPGPDTVLDSQSNAIPTVRVLRLESPPEGGNRIAAILKCAETISRTWRTGKDDDEPVKELYEVDMVESSRPATADVGGSWTWSARFSRSSSSVFSGLSAHSTNSLPALRDSHRVSMNLPLPEPGVERPFDAVIHFVPPAAAKDILKRTILVTHISRPFLSREAPATEDAAAATPASPPAPKTVKSRSRWLSRSLRIVTAPASLAPAAPVVPPMVPASNLPSRIIHLLPRTPPPNLLNAIETFLLSFSFPQSHSSFIPPIVASAQPGEVSRRMRADERPIAYLLEATTISEPFHVDEQKKKYTLADIVLSGSLGVDAPVGTDPAMIEKRTYIAGVNELALSNGKRPQSLRISTFNPPVQITPPEGAVPRNPVGMRFPSGSSPRSSIVPPVLPVMPTPLGSPTRSSSSPAMLSGGTSSRTPSLLGPSRATTPPSESVPTPPDSDESSIADRENEAPIPKPQPKVVDLSSSPVKETAPALVSTQPIKKEKKKRWWKRT